MFELPAPRNPCFGVCTGLEWAALPPLLLQAWTNIKMSCFSWIYPPPPHTGCNSGKWSFLVWGFAYPAADWHPGIWGRQIPVIFTPWTNLRPEPKKYLLEMEHHLPNLDFWVQKNVDFPRVFSYACHQSPSKISKASCCLNLLEAAPADTPYPARMRELPSPSKMAWNLFFFKALESLSSSRELTFRLVLRNRCISDFPGGGCHIVSWRVSLKR